MKTSTKTAKTEATKDDGPRYRVLIECRNDKTGAAFVPGDIVTAADFPKAIIYEWLEMTPPVLAAEVDNGSNPIDG